MPTESPNLLKPGDVLGPYRVDSLLGKGGMGEIYRGIDTRLGRPVAIKVSAREFSDRFEREAQAISSLNHPNVCTLYDVGPNYLVMEFVEGDTLAHLIKQGPMLLDKVLPYAIQIADALSAAHAKGVIHRDLKPANIILTSMGVKVLDFGLAKLNSGAKFGASGSELVTKTEPMTESGSILGTLHYMSPEQAEGKDTDERSDIFSFGAVLYEMLTGKRAFDGETKTAVLAAILKDQPEPISQFQPQVPRALDRVVRKCLEKKPADRWHSAHDLRQTLELIDLTAPPSSATASAGMSSASGIQPASPRLPKWLWPAIAVGVLALAAGGWEWWQSHRFTDLPLVRQDVDLGADIALPGPTQFVASVVISPDGTRLAYVARPVAGGLPRLYTRRLDQPMAVELPGTENARGPFFSPDGHWLGFASTSTRKLYKIAVDGGAAVQLMDLTGVFGGAAWSENTIVVAQLNVPLIRIPDTGGGQPAQLGPFALGEILQVSPQILPGGKTVLFAGNTGNEGGAPDPDRGSIEAISLAGGQRKNILKGGAFPRYVASRGGSGHVLYTFRGALYAATFDPDKLELRGTAVPVLNDVMGALNSAGKFDVSSTGTFVYQKGSGSGSGGLRTVQWIDSSGKSEPLLAKPGQYDGVRISPDGKRVALAMQDGRNQDIQVYEWQTGRTTSLTFGGLVYADPVWMPDGQFVLFRAANGGLYAARADGSGQPQQLTQGSADKAQVPWSVSPDGKRLAYFQYTLGDYRLWTAPVEDGASGLRLGPPAQFLKSEASDMMPQFSPDGKWIAYRSNLSGSTQIYVRPASGQAGQWVVSTSAAATSPVWSRSGHDLLYRDAFGNQVMAVGYTANADTFLAEKPRVWLARFDESDFDISPDGKRIIAIAPVQSAAPAAPQVEHEVVFLQNFFDELRRRVPGSR